MPHNVQSLPMYRRTAALQHYGLPTPLHRSVGTLSMTALPLPPVTSPPRRCCIAASTQRSPARPLHSRTLHRCSPCIAITARCQTSSDSLLTRRPSQSPPLGVAALASRVLHLRHAVRWSCCIAAPPPLHCRITFPMQRSLSALV